jgi:hypothetical protein
VSGMASNQNDCYVQLACLEVLGKVLVDKSSAAAPSYEAGAAKPVSSTSAICDGGPCLLAHVHVGEDRIDKFVLC